jgi:hypothetical protein
MPKVSGVRARNLIGSLMRKTLGHRLEEDDAAPATEQGPHDQLPKLSVLTPLQRRAMFSKSRPPPK